MALILVVDDDPHIRDIFGEYLTRHGHEVLQAANGKQALKHLSSTTVDVIILDIIMPECDGFEVLASMFAKAHPKIIVVTGGSQRLDTEMLTTVARRFPVDAVLTKPVILAQLAQQIEQLLETRAATPA